MFSSCSARGVSVCAFRQCLPRVKLARCNGLPASLNHIKPHKQEVFPHYYYLDKDPSWTTYIIDILLICLCLHQLTIEKLHFSASAAASSNKSIFKKLFPANYLHLIICYTKLNLSLSLSFTCLLLTVKYSSHTVQTVSSSISHQTWKLSSDWKITQWSPRSNYAGLVYDLSVHIHYPPLQNGEQPFNFSFQLAHRFSNQVGTSSLFLLSGVFTNCVIHRFTACVHCDIFAKRVVFNFLSNEFPVKLTVHYNREELRRVLYKT